MIEVAEFRIEDQFSGLEPVTEVFSSAEQLAGPAYTLRANGQVIACCGIQLMWEGVGEAWAIVSAEFGQHPRALQKMRAVVDWMIIKHRLRRIHAHMFASWVAGLRFARRFGLRPEHQEPLRGYFPNGDDCVVFVRFEPCQR